MAVIAKWMCDRDNSMFDNKKDADAHDKMLELAEQFTALMQQHIASIDEQQAEEFGILLAKHKDTLILACKGKPEVLADIDNADTDADNVTPINAEAN